MSSKAVIIKRTFLGLTALIAGFVGVVAMRPNTFKVERSATIAAPALAVFSQVNDFHRWEGWSPWEKMDPKMKKTFEGPPAGPGAIYSWDGNDEVGAGRMTLLKSNSDESIQIELEFFRPMEDVCTTDFTFKPEGNKTNVTWSMSGKYTFLSKEICMFMNMDKMVGGSFEQGLAQMKAIVETPPTQASAAEARISR